MSGVAKTGSTIQDPLYWYERYSALVEHVIRQNGIRDWLDAAQNFWVSFIDTGYAKAYDPNKGSESTYVYAIAAMRCRGYREVQKRLDSRYVSVAHLPESGDGGESYLDLRAGLAMAQEALKRLPVLEKRDFSRLFELMLAGLRVGEIAEVLGVSPSAVSIYQHKLREMPEIQALRDLLVA